MEGDWEKSFQRRTSNYFFWDEKLAEKILEGLKPPLNGVKYNLVVLPGFCPGSGFYDRKVGISFKKVMRIIHFVWYMIEPIYTNLIDHYESPKNLKIKRIYLLYY